MNSGVLQKNVQTEQCLVLGLEALILGLEKMET